jgi:hypothetical protein
MRKRPSQVFSFNSIEGTPRHGHRRASHIAGIHRKRSIGRITVGFLKRHAKGMIMILLLIIILVLLFAGGGGYYGYGRWGSRGGMGIGLGTVLLILLIAYMLGVFH